ncbi:NTF2 fold immunity protein [Chryseobacterium gotjawalense]|uniref:NTF2 fold immunity protein n=1 Tax=Chryseobacterium gotjawalense TaxID=3042315 RepID=A0ABY8RF50_9FLAO|nr:NTF2 fold immunity protein [Chryseobacterium sp. wdc7]WHF51813.1 NTF2 fold immunity protein [Chryseobacterium sp. wdc7]
MKKGILVTLLIFMCGLLLYYFGFSEEKYISENQQVINCEECLVKDEETAIKIAENKLFVMYGKSKIEEERPYNIDLVHNKVWVITGSLNAGILEKLLSGGMPMLGGAFEIKINAKDGKTINITHDK